jgi:hypothetical protein
MIHARMSHTEFDAEHLSFLLQQLGTLQQTQQTHHEIGHIGAKTEKNHAYRAYIYDVINRGDALSKDPEWRTTHLSKKKWTVKDWRYWMSP